MNKTQTTIELGRGRLDWMPVERVGDRYGTINFFEGERPVFDPSSSLPKGALGIAGSLVAEVTDPAQSSHVGDFFHGFAPSGPLSEGAEVELGHGTLFLDSHGVGLKPDRELKIGEKTLPADREVFWLDPRALYRVHGQGVILRFVPDEA